MKKARLSTHSFEEVINTDHLQRLLQSGMSDRQGHLKNIASAIQKSRSDSYAVQYYSYDNKGRYYPRILVHQ